MSRHQTTKQLSMYLDEQLASDEVRRLEQHLGDCAECHQRLEGLRRVVGHLQGLEPVRPPRSLGMELQRHLARAIPPFADRTPSDPHPTGRFLQPAVLGSLGIVLALAVITLLFLQVLQERQVDNSPSRPGRSMRVVEEADVIVGERAFHRTQTGWVESSLSPEEISAARRLTRSELPENLPIDSKVVVDQLGGELTLRLGEEVVHLVDD